MTCLTTSTPSHSLNPWRKSRRSVGVRRRISCTGTTGNCAWGGDWSEKLGAVLGNCGIPLAICSPGHADLARHAQPVDYVFRPFGGRLAYLDLVSAGRQSGHHAARVSHFDRDRFFTVFGGGIFWKP